MINKISDKKDARSKYIDLEIDKFLDKYEYANIYVRYNKNKFDTEEITKSLKKLRNKLIDVGEFNEKYNKFMDDFTLLNIINLKKSQVVFLQTKKNDKICKKFKRYCSFL